MSIAQNISEVQANIEKYAKEAGTKDVTLIGVSKTVGADAVLEAYEAGLLDFGENRVQEFLEKEEKLPKNIRWHIIGQLQTNKVKYIINNMYLLHSLDRLTLAEALQQECVKKDASVDALIQLNIAREETKSGVLEEELASFMEALQPFDRIHLRGFMTIGPNTEEKSKIRKCFAKTKGIFDAYSSQIDGFDTLSMGMSGDYHEAILEGATMVRVGSSVFGTRQYR